jgi:4-aminobutyrate aminotransferase-like enzyme
MKSDLPRISRPPTSGEVERIISRDIELMARFCRRRFPIVVRKIEGSIVFDVNDNAYIDFTGGFGMLPLGGQPPDVVKAVKNRADSSMTIPSSLYSEESVELAEELARIAPIRGDVRVLFRDSASEAIDAAARAMRWHSGKSVILAFTGSYHGSTEEALMLSASSRIRKPQTRISDMVYGVGRDCANCPIGLEPEKCRGDCLKFSRELVEAAAPDELAAIIFEPIGLEAPAPPPASYMEALKVLARDLGGLLVANERLTAPARTGRWFTLDHWNFKADAVCLGEQLASGLPLGVLVAREEVLDMEPLDHDSCGGCALSVSAALATLKAIRDEGLVERSGRVGRNILRRLGELAGELNWKAHGAGMLIGLRPLGADKRAGEIMAKTIVDECFRVGLLLWRIGATILITPALNIGEEILERGLEILEEKIIEISRRSQASST